MSDLTKAVAEWIDRNFEPETVKVQDFPAFPFGKLITDRNGDTMVVYYDIMTGKVAYTFPDEETERRGEKEGMTREELLRAIEEQAKELDTLGLLRLLDCARALAKKTN